MADNVAVPGTGAILAFANRTVGGVSVEIARTMNGYDSTAGTYTDVTDATGMPTRPRAPVPDTVVASGTIDPTTLNSLFSVTPNGNGAVVLKIGALGTTFPGGAVVTFEKVGVAGATAIATSVYPRGAANSGRIKSTTVGGEFIFAAESAVSVQARISTVGTGGTLPVSVQMAAPPAVQPVAPVNVGQTTRSFSEAASQKIVTSGTTNPSSAIAASEVEIQACTAALWYNRNAAAVAGSGSRRLAADERTVIQITPGDIIHVIQDTAAGYAVVTPVL